MNRDPQRSSRDDALARARSHSPFLREGLIARPEIADAFVAEGAEAAASFALSRRSDDVEVDLRRMRRGFGARGRSRRSAGELPLERATQLLSDFADSAIDTALSAAIADRVSALIPLASQ